MSFNFEIKLGLVGFGLLATLFIAASSYKTNPNSITLRNTESLSMNRISNSAKNQTNTLVANFPEPVVESVPKEKS